MVREGGFTNWTKNLRRFNGFFHDVRHISIYSPYCDAFVMDRAMASIVTNPRVDLEGEYGVKVFSANNLQQLSDWLDSLEGGITAEHRNGLNEAYPWCCI